MNNEHNCTNSLSSSSLSSFARSEVDTGGHGSPRLSAVRPLLSLLSPPVQKLLMRAAARRKIQNIYHLEGIPVWDVCLGVQLDNFSRRNSWTF